MKSRTVDFLFKSTFTDIDVNNIDRFRGNEYYDTNQFRDKYKLCLFHFLLPYLKLFYDDKCKITLTENLIERRDRYLRESDDFYGWFNDTYDIIDYSKKNKNKNKNKPFIRLKDLFRDFKQSSYYLNLTKTDKRSMTYQRFKEELLSRKEIKILYRGRYQPKINGKKLDITSCLIGLQKKVEINDSDSTDDES